MLSSNNSALIYDINTSSKFRDDISLDFLASSANLDFEALEFGSQLFDRTERLLKYEKTACLIGLAVPEVLPEKFTSGWRDYWRGFGMEANGWGITSIDKDHASFINHGNHGQVDINNLRRLKMVVSSDLPINPGGYDNVIVDWWRMPTGYFKIRFQDKFYSEVIPDMLSLENDFLKPGGVIILPNLPAVRDGLIQFQDEIRPHVHSVDLGEAEANPLWVGGELMNDVLSMANDGITNPTQIIPLLEETFPFIFLTKRRRSNQHVPKLKSAHTDHLKTPLCSNTIEELRYESPRSFYQTYDPPKKSKRSCAEANDVVHICTVKKRKAPVIDLTGPVPVIDLTGDDSSDEDNSPIKKSSFVGRLGFTP